MAGLAELRLAEPTLIESALIKPDLAARVSWAQVR